MPPPLHEGVRGQQFCVTCERVRLVSLGFIVLGINYLIVGMLYRWCFPPAKCINMFFKHFLHSLPSLGINFSTCLVSSSKRECDLSQGPGASAAQSPSSSKPKASLLFNLSWPDTRHNPGAYGPETASELYCPAKLRVIAQVYLFL